MEPHWYGALFYAYSSRGWMGFLAIQSDGRALLRHEHTFFRKTPDQVAKEVLAFQKAKGIARLIDVVAQPEIFPKTKQARGETVSETLRARGLHVTPGDKDRINGWARVRAWLDVREFRDDDREAPVIYHAPSLQVHADCAYFLDTFLTLVSDKDKPDDIEPTPDEYPASALRFWVMARPLPPQKIVRALPPDAIGHEINAIRRGLRRR